LFKRLEAYALSAERLHDDNTTVAVLAKGKTDPMPKLGQKRTPSDVVNHEIVQGFEKSPIILSLVASS